VDLRAGLSYVETRNIHIHDINVNLLFSISECVTKYQDKLLGVLYSVKRNTVCEDLVCPSVG
jgi:hypothetical protein